MKRILLQGLIVSCLCLPVLAQASDGYNSEPNPFVEAYAKHLTEKRAAQQEAGRQATIAMLEKRNQGWCIDTDPSVCRAREAVKSNPFADVKEFDAKVRQAQHSWDRLNAGTGNAAAAREEIARLLPGLK